MIQLHSLRGNPLPDGHEHGIWLAIKSDAKHAGLVFRVSKADGAQFLHLGFHHKLLCQSVIGNPQFADNYALLPFPGFDSVEQRELAVWFETIWRVNGRFVPYGLTYSGAGYFDPTTGKFVASERGVGLTCATFVMAVFEDFRLPVVDWETWEHRESDGEFQRSILDTLWRSVQTGDATHEHVEAQAAALDMAVRFRPAEVVAAGGAYLGESVAFRTAELLSRHLLTDLEAVVF